MMLLAEWGKNQIRDASNTLRGYGAITDEAELLSSDIRHDMLGV